MGFNSDFVITTFIYCTSTLVVSVLELLTGVPLNNCKLNQSMQLHRKLEIRWIYSQLYLPCFTLLWAPRLLRSAVSAFVRTFLVFEIPRWPLPRASVFVTGCSIVISWALFVSGRSFFRGSLFGAALSAPLPGAVPASMVAAAPAAAGGAGPVAVPFLPGFGSSPSLPFPRGWARAVSAAVPGPRPP